MAEVKGGLAFKGAGVYCKHCGTELPRQAPPFPTIETPEVYVPVEWCRNCGEPLAGFREKEC